MVGIDQVTRQQEGSQFYHNFLSFYVPDGYEFSHRTIERVPNSSVKYFDTTLMYFFFHCSDILVQKKIHLSIHPWIR